MKTQKRNQQRRCAHLEGSKRQYGQMLAKNGSVSYSVQFNRTYRDQEGTFHDTNSFDAGEALQISVLATDAYKTMSQLREGDKLAPPNPEPEF